MRFGVFYNWLLSLLLTLAVIIALILVVVNWSFQRGFVSYVRQNEIQQVERVTNLLAEAYAQQGSWRFLHSDHRNWPRLLETAGIVVPSPMREQPPRPIPGPGEIEPVPRPVQTQPGLMAAAVPLAGRLVLQDANRKRIVGPRIPVRKDHWYPVRSGGQVVGWLGLLPVEIVSGQLAQNFIEQQRANFAWISLAGLLLAVLVATVWARWFLGPIRRVMAAARQLAAGHYEVKVPVKGHNELSELAANFNQLARTLARNEQLRRQWIVDISHELRTPVAVIGGEVEAIMDGIREPTPERIAALHSEVGALGKLVDDLHLLSLADQATLELTMDEVDLYPLVREQLLNFEPRMEQRGLVLTLEASQSDGFVLRADARRLSQLIGNLLENSLKYTDPGGEIHLLLSGDNKYLVLEIQDSPPGVPKEDLEKIFERLYRVDKSRSRSLGGSGLGLAICREIVVAHGGKIAADNSPLGGLSIRVELPRNL